MVSYGSLKLKWEVDVLNKNGEVHGDADKMTLTVAVERTLCIHSVTPSCAPLQCSFVLARLEQTEIPILSAIYIERH